MHLIKHHLGLKVPKGTKKVNYDIDPPFRSMKEAEEYIIRKLGVFSDASRYGSLFEFSYPPSVQSKQPDNYTPNNDIDLQHLESQIDSKTKFILVNNVSNPLGTVWGEKHIKEIC